MSREPVRLAKKPEKNVSPLINHGWMLMHPAVILIILLLIIIFFSAFAFAITGGSAVESGGMRNFLARGM